MLHFRVQTVCVDKSTGMAVEIMLFSDGQENSFSFARGNYPYLVDQNERSVFDAKISLLGGGLRLDVAYGRNHSH